MAKSRYYFWVLAFGLIILGVGFSMHITEITNPAQATLHYMRDPWILIIAAISAFLLGNFRHYWVAVIFTGLLAAIFHYPFHYENGFINSLEPYTIVFRVSAFVCVVYFLNLIRLIFSRF